MEMELATSRQLAEELMRRSDYGIIFLCDKSRSPGDYFWDWKGNTVEVLGCVSYFSESYAQMATCEDAFVPNETGGNGDAELEDDDERDSDDIECSD